MRNYRRFRIETNELEVYGKKCLQLTHHAQVRMVSRGLNLRDLKMLYRFGSIEDGANGKSLYFIPENPFVQLKHPALDKLQGCKMVVSPDGCVITVMRKGDFYEC
jgi:hypothetical protein